MLGILSFYWIFLIFILIVESINNDSMDMIYILILPVYYFLITVWIRRSHDLNNSWWYILIPFYWLYLLFAKWDKWENKF